MVEYMHLPSPWLGGSNIQLLAIKRLWHFHRQYRPLLELRNLACQYAKLHHSIDLLIDRSCGLRPSMDRIRKIISPSQAHPRSLLGINLAALDGASSLAGRYGRCPAATTQKIRSTRPHCPGRDRMRRSRGHKQYLSNVEAFGETTRLLQRLAKQILFEVSGQFQQYRREIA